MSDFDKNEFVESLTGKPAEIPTEVPEQQAAPPADPPPPVDRLDAIEEILKQSNPDYKLPSYIREKKLNDVELSDQQIAQAIQAEFMRNTGDPFIKDYLNASSKPDFKPEEWLQQRTEVSNVMNLTGKDFARKYYEILNKQQNLELSPEDIEEEVERQLSQGKVQMKLFEKEAKEELKEFFSGNNNPEPSIERELSVMNQAVQATVNDYLSKIQGTNVIGGFEFGEADKTAFMQELPNFLKKSVYEINGNRVPMSLAEVELTKLLQDPNRQQDLYAFLYLSSKGRLAGVLHDTKERIKKGIQDTLEGAPREQFGSGPGEFDQKAFADSLKT